MLDVRYDVGSRIEPGELSEFYSRMNHDIAASPDQLGATVSDSAVLVTARIDGRLVGLARGVSDGLRGVLTECKLDPLFQGPGAVTRTDGRIEHDTYGIAAEMARRVIERLLGRGSARIDVLAWGTEVDFLEELGFKRAGGLVGLTLRTGDAAPAATAAMAAS